MDALSVHRSREVTHDITQLLDAGLDKDTLSGKWSEPGGTGVERMGQEGVAQRSTSKGQFSGAQQVPGVEFAATDTGEILHARNETELFFRAGKILREHCKIYSWQSPRPSLEKKVH